MLFLIAQHLNINIFAEPKRIEKLVFGTEYHFVTELVCRVHIVLVAKKNIAWFVNLH